MQHLCPQYYSDSNIKTQHDVCFNVKRTPIGGIFLTKTVLQVYFQSESSMSFCFRGWLCGFTATLINLWNTVCLESFQKHSKLLCCAHVLRRQRKIPTNRRRKEAMTGSRMKHGRSERGEEVSVTMVILSVVCKDVVKQISDLTSEQNSVPINYISCLAFYFHLQPKMIKNNLQIMIFFSP